MSRTFAMFVVAVAVAAAVSTRSAAALEEIPAWAAAGSGPAELPHVFRDAFGSNWDVQYDGAIGDGGNDLYDGGGRLFVNGVQYQSPTATAQFDAARNELTFPTTVAGGVNVSRRVAGFPATGAVRFTEVLENTGAATVRVPVRVYFNMGQAIRRAEPLVDARRPKDVAGYAMTDGNNSVAMVACGRSAKVRGQFDFQVHNDNVHLTYEVDVPPRQTAVLVHFQVRRPTLEEAADAWRDAREKDLLRDLPKDLRRRVANFPGAASLIGDLEVLRGEGLDVVELRGGDAYRGTLAVERYALQTAYGRVELPADRVASVLNYGMFRPTQLVVTSDGDVFGGRLDVDRVPLRLTGGQVTHVPIGQVTRIGYRRRLGEADDSGGGPEFVAAAYLRGGDRLRVKRSATALDVATIAGPVRLSPGAVSAVVFEGEDRHVPEVRLTDGSRLSALTGANALDVALTAPGRGGAEQRVRLPAAALLKVEFTAEPEVEPLAPSITLANGDVLIGTIGGTLSLETPFDTIHVEGPQIKAIAHAKTGDHDVTITLWDDSTLSGRLVESHVTCLLRCGVSLRVPVSLVARYSQPLPSPSPKVVDEIRGLVAALDAADWPTRERAQERILSLGPAGIGVLKGMRSGAPAEARERIDVMLQQLTAAVERQAAGTSGASAGRAGSAPAAVENLAPGEMMLNEVRVFEH